MAYYFYLDGLMLPQTPGSVDLTVNGRNKTVDLINEGEINLLKSPSLEEYKFDVTFPQFYYPFLAVSKDELRSIKYYVEFIEKLKRDKKTFPFVISRIKPGGEGLGSDMIIFNTDVICGVENFSRKEAAENGFDIVYTITLKEWKHYGTRIIDVLEETDETITVKEETVRSTSKTDADIPDVYTVQNNDTLSAIAKKFFDDGSKSKYMEIAKINNISNPNLIYTGQKIKLKAK